MVNTTAALRDMAALGRVAPLRGAGPALAPTLPWDPTWLTLVRTGVAVDALEGAAARAPLPQTARRERCVGCLVIVARFGTGAIGAACLRGSCRGVKPVAGWPECRW